MTKSTSVIASLLLCLVLIFAGTGNAQVKTINYKESQEDIPNPDRGFYFPAGEEPGKLSAATLTELRTIHSIKAASAKYPAWVTLLYRSYLFSDFKQGPISEDYLEKIRQDLAEVRKAGMKVVLRFAYTNDAKNGDCGDENNICPPYGDAPKHVVLQHIKQLKPIFIENADVISVLQQGFIGIWGENHYTDYFGAGSHIIQDSSWRDRNEVLKALLDALPKERMVQVRTPQFKQRFVHGPKAPVNTAPLSEDEAFNLSYASRIALHNDCFLASTDDYGTFFDLGNSTSPRGPANEVLRKFFEADSRYVAVGGETCDDAFSPQNDCAPLGRAEQEMEAMHYSFLNVSYNNLVNNDWEAQGCMMNIKRRLGYRLVIDQAVLPVKIKAGKSMHIELKLRNAGFASPYNPRPAELVMREIKTGKILTFPIIQSIQKLYSEEHTLSSDVIIPADTASGKYEVLFSLPDGHPSLKNRPEYAIRLANESLWEPETGFNKLNHTITVN